MSVEVDPKNIQKLELLKQHYHELIEAKNKEIREDKIAQERLQKSMRVTPDACIERSPRT